VSEHGHPELDHLGPERVIVILAVETVEVLIGDVLLKLWVLVGGVLVGERADRPAHAAGDVDRLEP
jgi:hypothetical protein